LTLIVGGSPLVDNALSSVGAISLEYCEN
jgi:hypothetical protein